MKIYYNQSESEFYLLPSRFSPTWNLFWCIGAYSEHKTYKHKNTISTTKNTKSRAGVQKVHVQ